MLPFLVMLVLVGMPLMLLELGLGQKLRVGAAGAWKKVGKLMKLLHHSDIRCSLSGASQPRGCGLRLKRRCCDSGELLQRHHCMVI